MLKAYRCLKLLTSVRTDPCKVGRISSTFWSRSLRTIPTDWKTSGSSEMIVENVPMKRQQPLGVPWRWWCNVLAANQECRSSAGQQLWPDPWQTGTPCPQSGPALLWEQAEQEGSSSHSRTDGKPTNKKELICLPAPFAGGASQGVLWNRKMSTLTGNRSVPLCLSTYRYLCLLQEPAENRDRMRSFIHEKPFSLWSKGLEICSDPHN